MVGSASVSVGAWCTVTGLLVLVLLLSCLVFFPAAGRPLIWSQLSTSVAPATSLLVSSSPLEPVPSLPLESRVFRACPTLPPVPTRHDIADRRTIVEAFVRETPTEPLALPSFSSSLQVEEDTSEDGPTTPSDFAPTQTSRTLKLLSQLKTLPKMKALQSSLVGPRQPLQRRLDPPPLPRRLPPKRGPLASENLSLVGQEMDQGVLLRHEDVAGLRVPRSPASSSSSSSVLPRPTLHRSCPIAELIELVLYINQNEHRFQRAKIEKELTRMFLKEDRIEVLRVLGEKRDDMVLAKLLSHVSALSIACEAQRNVLVLEDTFKFYVTRDDLQDHLRLAQREFGDRWNVIVLGPTASEWAPVTQGQSGDIQLMRILQGNFTSGYLVNRTYLPALLNLMIEHIYVRYPDTVASGTAGSSDLQQQLHQLQRSDVWLGFQSPLGGTRNETLDEMATLTGAEEKPGWTIQKHGVYIKASVAQSAELNNLLRHLYLERYKGHRLFVAVHHPPGQKLAQRHKRSFSSTFYEGVQYFSQPADVETYLHEFDSVQWIDLTTWCQTEDAVARLIRVLDDSGSDTTDDNRSPTEVISVASSECTIPCLNAHQRHKILSP